MKNCAIAEYHNDPSKHIPKLIRVYQYYVSTYSQGVLLYLIDQSCNNLLIYNTETGSKESRNLKTPEALNLGTCITQLPNGKLFCYGKYDSTSGISLIIDGNDEVQELPSGPPCGYSSSTCFLSNVYCFGGIYKREKYLTLSMKYDLDANRWFKLASMPQADFFCNSIVFNGNILISGYLSTNIFLYSIDIDSFSTISYEFAEKKRKILISAERLYLIECTNGSIYESEIGSYAAWARIADSNFSFLPFQISCSYNKGAIYIGGVSYKAFACYFKFNLDEKSLVELENSPY